jgi:drug/metabolite transporter (DMT)-like permease
MFASMGVCIRFVADELPNESIVFFRNLLGLVLLTPWLLRGGLVNFRTGALRLHLVRALAGLSAMYCFFYAIAHIALAEAMLLKLTAPLFIPLVALAWLGEGITVRIAGAIAVGFAGVLLILRPGIGVVSPVALVALLGGLFAAVAKVAVRRLSRTEPPARIVFYFALIATLASSVPLWFSWQSVSPLALGWLFAVALFATFGQLCLTRRMSLAAAARMGTFGYFAVIFGAGYGWLLWGEVMGRWTLAGSLFIFLSGLLVAGQSSGAEPRRATAPAGALES